MLKIGRAESAQVFNRHCHSATDMTCEGGESGDCITRAEALRMLAEPLASSPKCSLGAVGGRDLFHKALKVNLDGSLGYI
jgi:hypothetical protein